MIDKNTKISVSSSEEAVGLTDELMTAYLSHSSMPEVGEEVYDMLAEYAEEYNALPCGKEGFSVEQQVAADALDESWRGKIAQKLFSK